MGWACPGTPDVEDDGVDAVNDGPFLDPFAPVEKLEPVAIFTRWNGLKEWIFGPANTQQRFSSADVHSTNRSYPLLDRVVCPNASFI